MSSSVVRSQNYHVGQATIKKASRERLSEILHRQKPWKEHSINFQKRMRKEWQSSKGKNMDIYKDQHLDI